MNFSVSDELLLIPERIHLIECLAVAMIPYGETRLLTIP